MVPILERVMDAFIPAHPPLNVRDQATGSQNPHDFRTLPAPSCAPEGLGPNPCAIAESVCRYHVKATAPIVDALVPMLTTCATTTRPAHLSRWRKLVACAQFTIHNSLPVLPVPFVPLVLQIP